MLWSRALSGIAELYWVSFPSKGFFAEYNSAIPGRLENGLILQHYLLFSRQGTQFLE